MFEPYVDIVYLRMYVVFTYITTYIRTYLILWLWMCLVIHIDMFGYTYVVAIECTCKLGMYFICEYYVLLVANYKIHKMKYSQKFKFLHIYYVHT